MTSAHFQYEGLIEKSGVTIYMYGTHTISGNGKCVALQSSVINLDQYINKNVLVNGKKIDGYPIDDGPELIDVEIIREK